MRPEDGRLADACAATATAAREGAGWLERNGGRSPQESQALARELRRSAATARRLERACRRPMCVGVFGPSQSGKSYLISALARRGTEPLWVDLAGTRHDFLRDINPEGGRESTGLVTRFTLAESGAAPDRTDAAFPVALRLLTQTDIVRILGNTYFADCDDPDGLELDPRQVARRLDALERKAADRPVDPLDAEEVLELQDYFEQSFRTHGRVRALGAGFWERAAALAPRLPAGPRAELFGLVWGEIDGLTRLYRRLYDALAGLGFATDAAAPLDALVPREESIIDVQTLGALDREDAPTLSIRPAGGAPVALPRPVVAALTAELRMPLIAAPHPFFRHTDLLDFPGARSREQIADPGAFIAERGGLATLFLRGKVAYLFERYCTEQELTAMLLCIGPSNLEVKGLPEMVARWIAATHGATAAERAAQRTALFLVLTKFDTEFEQKKGESDNAETRWSIRLFASLLDPFGKQHDWPTDWDGKRGFRNTFWLRNPNIKAKALFDYDGDRETGLRAGEAGHVAAMKRGYLANADVGRHFADPEAAWEAGFALNDGGVSYLAERLAPVCDPQLKHEQITGRLATLAGHVAERLRPYHRADDASEAYERARRVAQSLGKRLVTVASAQRFGQLLEQLQMDEEEVIGLALTPRRADAEDGEGPRAAPLVGTRVDSGAMLAALGLGEAAESAPAGPVDEAERFAGDALAHWIERLYRTADDSRLQHHFALSPEDFARLVDELTRGADRLALREALAEAVRRSAAFRNVRWERLAAKQAGLAAHTINGFVDWLGFAATADGARPAISGRAVFAPPPEPGDLPALAATSARFDQAYYVDWIAAFMRLVEDNAGHRHAGDVDPAENRRLGDILQQLARAA